MNRIVKTIFEKYNKRTEKINQIINTGDGALDVQLVNFNTYLIKKYNKINMAKWLLLN